ncbi:MAG: chromosomal replication initiator protein DnaA [Anaerostipes sp.]|nr:chromosomal replication initiator protein DnaA [Anaerostipes sp.]MDD3747476.1 chromosomal replication initiator protein DnaA [Anaerostipes sp.]
MKNEIQKIWNQVLVKLETDHGISNAAINSWIKPLIVAQVTDDTILLALSNRFDERGIQFITTKTYDYYISLVIEELTGKNYKIKLVLESELNKTLSKTESSLKKENSNQEKRLNNNNNLNPKYTFDSFVIGSNNQMAHAACIAVAEAPAEAYNPLFLYGGAGLGKTHLMHSIAHYIIENRSELKVVYVTSEDFTNEVIQSIQHNRQEQLRNKYRNADILLVDDIQFIKGKDTTQLEFFHTFNALYNSKKQIVLSSDKPPKDLEDLEERLITRFGCGLTVDIQAPDYETRIAILRKRSEFDNIYISDEILDYIATNIKSNIRELEGALNKIRVFSKINRDKPLDLELAKSALKDLVHSDKPKTITPKLIVETVSEHFNIQPTDIFSKKRSKDIAHPRQVCMYLCKTYTDTSYVKIGEYLGKRDHTTIIHGVDKITNDLKSDDNLANSIDVIVKKMSSSNL